MDNFSKSEKNVIAAMKGLNSYEQGMGFYEEDNADLPDIEAVPKVGGVAQFSAQFDLSILVNFYTLSGGSYTKIAPAALDATLQNQLPVFLFGYTDFAAGYAKHKQEFSLNSNWNYGRPGIFGKDDFSELAFDNAVLADLRLGDMVQVFTSPQPGAGTTTLALVITRCNSIGFGSLLQSISSDTFLINNIRYVIPDATKIAQYSQQISFNNLSLFGKFNKDFISPQSYKKPNQFQENIVDVTFKYQINKDNSFSMFLNYDVGKIDLSVFVKRVNKLK